MPGSPLTAPDRPSAAGLLDRYDLDPHEVVLLDSAAHTADLIAGLQAVVDRDGPWSTASRTLAQ